MTEGQSLYDVAERYLRGVRDVVDRAAPDLMLVQGDTATVLFASMVGYFEKTRVGHVEAGLRSHDKWSPFPEEMFRRLSDDLADLHLAPTRSAAENLRAEGTDPDNVYVTGKTQWSMPWSGCPSRLKTLSIRWCGSWSADRGGTY